MIRDNWLARTNASDIAVYMVWSDQLGAKEKNVGEAATLLADKRVSHFWDGDEVTGAAFRKALRAPGNVWDVWMLFDRNARWDNAPPRPAWWEHQLSGLPRGRFLDGTRFANHAQAL